MINFLPPEWCKFWGEARKIKTTKTWHKRILAERVLLILVRVMSNPNPIDFLSTWAKISPMRSSKRCKWNWTISISSWIRSSKWMVSPPSKCENLPKKLRKWLISMDLLIKPKIVWPSLRSCAPSASRRAPPTRPSARTRCSRWLTHWKKNS